MKPSPFDRLKGIKEVDSVSHNSQQVEALIPGGDISSDGASHKKEHNVGHNISAGHHSSQEPMQNKVHSNMNLSNSMQADRVATGIRGFDDLIQGGFKANTINLLSGSSGTGKTIFAVEFILNGIKMFNETGVYISFDERQNSIFDNMKSLGWDLDELSKQGKFFFVEYNPSQLQQMLNEGGGLLDNLMAKTKGKRLVIDSISTFLMMSSDEFSRREQLSAFFRLLKKWNVTTLMTNEYTPITGNEIGKQTLSIDFETDSIIQMYYVHDDIGENRKRMIEVYKMRGTNHVTKAVPYKIDQKGIDIMDL